MSNNQEFTQQAVQKAWQAILHGDYKSARRWAESASAASPDLEEPWLILAGLSDPSESIQYLEYALRINPKSKHAREGMHWAVQKLREKELGKHVHVLRGTRRTVNILRSHPDPEMMRLPWRRLWAAVVAILIIILIWHDMTRALSGVFYLTSNIIAKQASSTNQESTRLLQYGEFLDRNAVSIYNREGYLWYQNGDLPNAEITFIKAFRIDPNNGPVLNNLAVTFFTAGQLQQAIILQQEAVKNDPDCATVRYNLGIVLARQSNVGDALHAFKEAIYINPNWVLPYLQQGIIYVQLQNYTDAEQTARTAIKLDSSQQSAHLTLAIALYNQGKDREALSSIEYALRIAPNDRVSQFYKAQILRSLGELDMALLLQQRLLKTSSDPLQNSRIAAEIEALNRDLQSTPAGSR